MTVRQSKISTLAFKLYAIRAEASALCQLLEAITNAYYGILFTPLAVLATATLAEVTGKFNVASFLHATTDRLTRPHAERSQPPVLAIPGKGRGPKDAGQDGADGP